MVYGIALGALGLTLLSGSINLLLLANQPYIFELEIPLLLVAQRFGSVIQALLLVIIWLEMFSTEVSDVYSISKTLEQSFNIKFKKGIFIVLAVALPISQIRIFKFNFNIISPFWSIKLNIHNTMYLFLLQT